jgi:hypothetical protein
MRSLFFFAVLLAPTPAAAEVVSAGPNGFEVRHSVNLVIPQAKAYTAFSEIQNWWSKDHTYSGNAANLSIQLRPGGCFCERLDRGGGIEHMHVTYVQPDERVVMTGSLGPLLYEATAGVMDVKVERIAGGSRITMDYRAAGFAKGGAAELAPIVDRVLGDQMKRLRVYAAGGAPKP